MQTHRARRYGGGDDDRNHGTALAVTIRPANLDDVEAIKKIAVDTNMFTADEADFVDDMVGGALGGTLEDHHWLVHTDDTGDVNGAAYYAPEPFSDRMWNLYFITVAPEQQGDGIGAALIGQVEAELRRRGSDEAQVIIVETSSTEQYARTREFYPKQGYVEEARIRRFYGPSDDKVVFWKSITPLS